MLDFEKIEKQLAGLTVDDMIDTSVLSRSNKIRWEVSTSELKSVFSVVKHMVSKSPLGKLFRISRSKYGIKLSATDGNSCFSYELELKNNSNIMDASFFILYSSMESLVPLFPDDVTSFYQENNILYVELKGGIFPIQTTQTDIFSVWDTVEIGKKIGKFETNNLKNVIRDTIPYVLQSEQMQDRRVVVEKESDCTYLYGSYRWSMLRTPLVAEQAGSMEWRIRDIQAIKLLMQHFPSENIHFYQARGGNVPLLAVQGIRYEYLFVKNDYSTSSMSKKLLSSFSKDHIYFFADRYNLNQVLDFCNKNEEIQENIGFLISSNSLFILMHMKNGLNTTFRINGYSPVDLPEWKAYVQKHVAYSTFKSVSPLEETDFLEVGFSQDQNYLGFFGVSDSLISCSQGETI